MSFAWNRGVGRELRVHRKISSIQQGQKRLDVGFDDAVTEPLIPCLVLANIFSGADQQEVGIDKKRQSGVFPHGEVSESLPLSTFGPNGIADETLVLHVGALFVLDICRFGEFDLSYPIKRTFKHATFGAVASQVS